MLKKILYFLVGIYVQILFCSAVFANDCEIIARSKPMLHTFVEIKACGINAEQAIEAAFAEMERVNALLNNYNPASDIAKINQHAGGDPVLISEETMVLLSIAKNYGDISAGALDITIGPLLQLWGFAKDEVGLPGSEPDLNAIRGAKSLVNYRNLELVKQKNSGVLRSFMGRLMQFFGKTNPLRRTARLKRKGMWIDVGSLSKGYVADRAAKILKKWGIEHALIAAGGTILAMGHKPDLSAWQVGIQHPQKVNGLLAVIALENKCMSTSGDYEIYYFKNGKKRTHIIDPRTGKPVEHLQSVSVIALTGVGSDALSTALFVMGPKKGIDLVNSLADVEAMTISEEGSIVFSDGWPQRNISY